ncbi:MAG: hypothetical protein DRQ88_08095 [Epsilonproteobacteria bacterium]|nr:MAG: hypothetical protein DRQ89_09115 [Campylobacterota bacterium]RLA66013.1 MAG: hypothetical protein DRQ88_08095 [Campylobacterota bacterium]
MKEIVFIFVFFSFGTSAEWKQIIKVNKVTDNSEDMIFLLTDWDSIIKKNFQAISLGSLKRPALISFALNVSDVVWKNEPTCNFELNEDRPIVKNYENSYIKYRYPSGKVFAGSVGEGDREEWKNWRSPCEYTDYLVSQKFKIKD